MRFANLDKRLDLLQPEECPGCAALAALSDEELDRRINHQLALRDGREDPAGCPGPLPKHWPNCPELIRERAMSKADMEARIDELLAFR